MKILCLLVISASLLVTGCAADSVQSMLPPPSSAASSPIGDLLIISATYGSGTSFADVTARVNYWLRQPDGEFYARPEWLKADPTPGWNKALVIVYECRGRRHIFTAGEAGRVSLADLRKVE